MKVIKILQSCLPVLVGTIISCIPRNSGKSNNQTETLIENYCDSITDVKKEDPFQKLIWLAKAENKKIFLLFSFEGCAFCRIFKNYHNDPVVKEILSSQFVISEIDVNHFRGGKELYSKFGSPGFPSWAIIDSSENVLAYSRDSIFSDSNFGFPFNVRTRDLYIIALRKCAPLTTSECEILIQKMKYYRPGNMY